MKISEARYRANRKHDAKAYDRTQVTFYKGEKDAIKEYAHMQGYSFNGFIREAIVEKLQAMDAPKEILKKW